MQRKAEKDELLYAVPAETPSVGYVKPSRTSDFEAADATVDAYVVSGAYVRSAAPNEVNVAPMSRYAVLVGADCAGHVRDMGKMPAGKETMRSATLARSVRRIEITANAWPPARRLRADEESAASFTPHTSSASVAGRVTFGKQLTTENDPDNSQSTQLTGFGNSGRVSVVRK
jgi:hypothetical protein